VTAGTVLKTVADVERLVHRFTSWSNEPPRDRRFEPAQVDTMSYLVRLALVVVISLSAQAGASAQEPRMKVVLDTDIGTDIDDAWRSVTR
jgi:hypothetical protein